jgi:hypothetical protein
MIKDCLIVKDNFFNKKVYEEILLDISRLKFENRNVSIKDSLKSAYQTIYFNVPLDKQHFAVKESVKILNDFGFNIYFGDSFYFLSAAHKAGATVHNDSADLNCLIYIKGRELMNSGTAFYDYNKEEDEYILRTHVGFKENRALIFDSKIYHSTTQFEEGSSSRYVMANFFNLKEKANAQ